MVGTGAFFLALSKFYFSKFGKKIEGRGIITVNYLLLACFYFFIFLFHSGRELWCFLYFFFNFIFGCFFFFFVFILSFPGVICGAFFFWLLFLCFFSPCSELCCLFIYLFIIFFAFSFLGMSCGAIYLFFGFN